MTAEDYSPPPFEEADSLCNEIMSFLLECGGIYVTVNRHLQEVILESIASGQYVLHRNESGGISHWLAYWKIQPEDAEDIETTKPIDTRHGSVLFIIEHGNKDGRKGMTKMIQELRQRSAGMQGVLWNSKGRGIKKFMKQKGV